MERERDRQTERQRDRETERDRERERERERRNKKREEGEREREMCMPHTITYISNNLYINNTILWCGAYLISGHALSTIIFL